MKKVLITGATGNIGARLVVDILCNEPETEIVTLVRAKTNSDALMRTIQAMRVFMPAHKLESEIHRLCVLRSDITDERLKLSPGNWQRLAEEITHIVHAAAATKFQLPIEQASRTNHLGTLNLLALANVATKYHLQHMAHISTAYTCGTCGGEVAEMDHLEVPRFCNAYEESKWQAEQSVRRYRDRIPVSILRPTIVVGDSSSGAILNFNVLYQPLRLILHELVKNLPCSPHAQLDIVPLNYVASAIRNLTLHCMTTSAPVVHIAAGANKQTTVGEVVSLFCEYVNGRRLKDRTLRVGYEPTPFQKTASRNAGASADRGKTAIGIFAPYLQIEHSFETACLQMAMNGSGITLPCFHSYSTALFDFCFACNWGKAMKSAA